MKRVAIKYIDFKSYDEANENINYPSSGLFVVRMENGPSDLRLVDKSIANNYCVVPEHIFNNCCEIIEEKTESESVIDKDFILEFSKILLSKK